MGKSKLQYGDDDERENNNIIPRKVGRENRQWEDVQLVNGEWCKSEKRNPKLDLKQQEINNFYTFALLNSCCTSFVLSIINISYLNRIKLK